MKGFAEDKKNNNIPEDVECIAESRLNGDDESEIIDFLDALKKQRDKKIYRIMRKIISRLGSHIVEGVEYPNLPSIAKAYGLKFNSVYKRYSRGCRGDRLVPKRKLKSYKPKIKKTKYKLIVNGVGYKSKQDACRKNNVNYVTFRKRYEEYGWSLERSLSIPSGLTRGGQGVHSSKKITVENKTFNSISDAARYYKLTPETVASIKKWYND